MTGLYELTQVYELKLSMSRKRPGFLSLEQTKHVQKICGYVKLTFPLLS